MSWWHWPRQMPQPDRRYPVVLLYHRVADLDMDPQRLAVTPAHFEQHVQVMRRLAHATPLREIRTAGAGVLPGAVAITFDDGYADNLLNAEPILRKHGVPATVFVASGFIGGERPFYWDELANILLRLPDHLDWHVERPDDPTPRHAQYRSLCREMHRQTPAAREQTMMGLRPSDGRTKGAVMDAAQLRKLAEGGLVEIGAHTRWHPCLAALSAKEQQQEIIDGRSDLEAIIGRPVTAFAYPYGTRRDFNRRTQSLVRLAGFDCAWANTLGSVAPDCDPFALPRVLVRDMDGEAFERFLRTWIAV